SKGRYRRHPPRDPNAPIRPDTAYVAYVKFMRQDPEIASLSFIEIAKLLGYQWSYLSSTVKGIWIRTAAREREEYTSAFVRYRQTDEYRVF
ncbi:high mobility group box domain-containing protein, partial [Bisporella sp. PMI_857]